MSRYHPRSPNFGRPVVTMHLEARTEDCICAKLPSCGGVVSARIDCPEHGADSGPIGTFHTHPMQTGGVTRGRHIA
jgi:hypothetical protein